MESSIFAEDYVRQNELSECQRSAEDTRLPPRASYPVCEVGTLDAGCLREQVLASHERPMMVECIGGSAEV